MKKKILITGGAGYIGQVIAWYLKKKNFIPIILDRSSKKKIKQKRAYLTYNYNISEINKILDNHKCDTIIHCASSNIVWESKNNPIKYYRSNVSDTIEMLSKAKKYKIKNIIYASSSSVYGDVRTNKKISESENLSPISCYGRTKKMNEDIIKDFALSYNFNYIFLRLFNVSGAINNNDFFHGPSRNSTTVIARAVTLNSRNEKKKYLMSSTKIKKKKHATPMRDFTHVEDIAQAFFRSLVYLKKNKKNQIFNIGSGSDGISVLDLIKKIELVLNVKIPYSVSKKIDNIGYMVPDIQLAKKILKYKPTSSSLENIIKSLDEWYKRK